jgi:hypothetical protein
MRCHGAEVHHPDVADGLDVLGFGFLDEFGGHGTSRACRDGT